MDHSSHLSIKTNWVLSPTRNFGKTLLKTISYASTLAGGWNVYKLQSIARLTVLYECDDFFLLEQSFLWGMNKTEWVINCCISCSMKKSQIRSQYSSSSSMAIHGPNFEPNTKILLEVIPPRWTRIDSLSTKDFSTPSDVPVLKVTVCFGLFKLKLGNWMSPIG